MKARMATILSLVGVLSAGSAAAMVNTRVLGDSAPAATTPALLSVVGTPTSTSIQLPTTVVVTVAPAGSAAPTSVATATANTAKVSTQANTNPVVVATVPTAPAPVTSAPASVPKVSVYNVGEAGAISIQSWDGTLSVTAVSPGAGWRVSGSNPSTVSSPATVVLASSSVEVTFTATLAGGNVVTNVTSRSLAVPTTPAPSYNDDDDDENEHEDEYEDDDD